MTTAYLLVTLGVLLWKAYHAWLRGRRCYDSDRRAHDSLREYLLGNGATTRQSLHPFVRHAMQRAFRPLTSQWRLLVVLTVLALLVPLVSDGVALWLPLGLLAALLALVAAALWLTLYVYTLLRQ